MTDRRPTALVTGSAGFIGSHVATGLLKAGYRVIGFDAMTDYYDVRLKQRRHQRLLQNQHFEAVEERLETPAVLMDLLAREHPDVIVHLAAQAGVRYSIEEPESYVTSNLDGTFRLLEAVRAHPPRHMLMASTSSVYGANTEQPYTETDKADFPLSFYAATKKAAEAMTHSYAHLFDLPITMFRFFTVYGPWGRPDMALFKFVKAMLEGRPIDVYNHGDMRRDFTYIDDLADAVCRLVEVPPVRPESADAVPDGDSLSPVAPWRVVNIGNGQTVELKHFIDAIERALGLKAERNLLPMQPGDAPATWARTDLLEHLIGPWTPTSVDDGVERFVRWYRDYYQV